MQTKPTKTAGWLTAGLAAAALVFVTGCFGDGPPEQYIRLSNPLAERVRLVINGRQSAVLEPTESRPLQLFDIDNPARNPEQYVILAYELVDGEPFEQEWFEAGVKHKGHLGRLRFCQVYGQEELMSRRLVTVTDNVPVGATVPQTGDCPSVGG